jgi:hypothetical protein
MEMAVKQIDPHSSKKLHLSFDMDVVDLPTSQVLRLSARHCATCRCAHFE